MNLSSEVSAMFNSLMPSLNSRSLPFVVFLGGFQSRCQNLGIGAIRPGGLLFENGDDVHRSPFYGGGALDVRGSEDCCENGCELMRCILS